MKLPRHFLALLLSGLHLVWCLCFFYQYFHSQDPNRGMAFVLFIPIDPWIILFSVVEASDVVLATLLLVLGTAQWWGIGWLLHRGYQKYSKKG
jgi:hypothetical protein